MQHQFQDKSFKHKPPKWWQMFNIVNCLDFTGGLSGGGTLYKVYSLRLWSIEVKRFAIVQHGCDLI